jgi:hypothetical protein
MRNTVLATAIAAVLTLGAADASAQTKGAVTKDEIESMQAQMQALVERMNRLEAANTELKAQNSELQELADRREAEMDYLKVQTKDLREESAVASNEISKVKGADWATKIKGRGDFRFRNENIWVERPVGSGTDDAAMRERMRIRARLGFDFKATDNISGTLLFATGGDDPRSANQTLGGGGTRKTIGLDIAYVDWRFMQGGSLALGKMPFPIFRPGQSVFYDNDYNAEGGALKFERGMFFATGYGWWLTEGFAPDPDNDLNHDSRVFGLQAGLKFPLLGGETVLAANYYECGLCQDNSPLYLNNGNGNTTYRVGTSPVNLLQYGYDIAELSAQSTVTVRDQPLVLWANYAQNLADGVEYDTAYALGAKLGRASNPKTWEVGVLYQSLDKDALFGQWVDSNFGEGRTDSEGWMLRAAYAPVKNFTVDARYFMNTINKDVGTELDYDRLMIDLNYKF